MTPSTQVWSNRCLAPADEPQSKPSQLVTVVVVTFNSSDLVPDLLSSLDEGMGDSAFRLVVVDNASSDGTVGVVRQMRPDASIVNMGRNAGYAAGINAGVAASSDHRAILVLNPDVRLAPDCLKALMDALEEPGCGVAVPRLFDAQGNLIESMRREPTVLRMLADAILGGARVGRWGALGEVVTDPRHYESEATPDWAEGSTQLISAECWRACGPWDESFFLYSEETDFNLRARDAGYVTRFTPAAKAVHLEGGSGSSPRLYALMAVNRVRLHYRRHGMIMAVLFWFAATLREGIRAVLGREANREAFLTLTQPRHLLQTPGPEFLRSRRSRGEG